jgi:hypothetical protein
MMKFKEHSLMKQSTVKLRSFQFTAALLVAVLIAASASIVPGAGGAREAEASSSSGYCKGGWFSTHELSVNSGSGVISYSVKMNNYWPTGTRTGTAKGRFVHVRSWWPDKIVQERPISWTNGNTSFSGQVSYSALGVKRGQSVKFDVRANGPGSNSGTWVRTCPVTITLG